ncbi:MAG TPA: tetratricopeptide repeat protein, partial [Dongiaceae bacterium]|nr:tetratricopeptide repeat protein [Dongiaceae bacterium]
MPDFARPLPVLALAFIAGLSGCAATPEEQVPDTPPENLYNKASNALDQGQDSDAAKLFEEVQRQHPYSAL